MFLLILVIAFVATLLSSMSGGGSSMITIPTWLMIGFPLPVAIAAGELNGALWTPIAARNYLVKHRIDWRLISGLALFGLCGAYFGAQVIMGGDATLLQRIFGILILLLVCLVAVQKQFGLEAREPSTNRLTAGILALPLGFYETFFGSGNGIFTSAMLIRTRGLTLTTALGYYYTISFLWCCFGTFLYIDRGFGDVSLMVPSSLGSMAGAYIGSAIGARHGSRFIKLAFLTIGTILGLKLALPL